MLEEGWAKNTEINGSVEEDEMWLMYCKWHMRVVCNTILDYSLHNLNMSKEEGLNLLMIEAFQEKAEAEGKWKRATLTQVQLCSYFTGYSEIHDLREAIKQKVAELNIGQVAASKCFVLNMVPPQKNTNPSGPSNNQCTTAYSDYDKFVKSTDYDYYYATNNILNFLSVAPKFQPKQG